MPGRELSLADMIGDPMVQQVMRSDGVTTEELMSVMKMARHNHCCPSVGSTGNPFSPEELSDCPSP